MFDVSVNLVAIVVAAVVNMVLGFLWYGPLFGKPWMKLMGYTKESISMNQKEMTRTYLTSFVTALIMAWVLSYFVILTGAVGVVEGMTVGFWAWIGFVATTMFSGVLYGKKSLNLYAIDSGYYFVALLVMGAIVASWM